MTNITGNLYGYLCIIVIISRRIFVARINVSDTFGT